MTSWIMIYGDAIAREGCVQSVKV